MENPGRPAIAMAAMTTEWSKRARSNYYYFYYYYYLDFKPKHGYWPPASPKQARPCPGPSYSYSSSPQHRVAYAR